MATLNRAERAATTTHCKLASTNCGIPTISIPETFKAGRYSGIEFTIPTTSGEVSASARWDRIYVKGRIEELLFLGLVRLEWLPGAPGNGKVLQTVVFEATGSRLLCSRERRQGLPYISIQRNSRSTYTVEIPATDHQIELIKRVDDERKAQEERATQDQREIEQQQFVETARLRHAPKSASEFRNSAIELSHSVERMLTIHMEEYADFYRMDDVTEACIRKNWDELRGVFSKGRVIPMERARHQEGTVVFLGHHKEASQGRH